MSNNKKIVSMLFSVVVLSSSVQVSAVSLRQFNPSSWNVRGRLSALNIGFPQFLKGWMADKKPVEIELPELPCRQEAVEETTRKSFFSRLFSRPRFRMPRIDVRRLFTRLFAFDWLKRNNKSSEDFSSIFPEVNLQSSSIYRNEIEIAEDPGELNGDIDGLNDVLEHKANLYQILCKENELASSVKVSSSQSSPYDVAQGMQHCLSSGTKGKRNGTPPQRNPKNCIIPFRI